MEYFKLAMFLIGATIIGRIVWWVLKQTIDDFRKLLGVVFIVGFASCNNLDILPGTPINRPDSFIVKQPDTITINKQIVVSSRVKIIR